MHLNLLKTFLAVAKHRSISRASEELYLTQPAVTKQVQVLEQLYETSLFERKGRELTMTDEGRTLADYAHRLVDLFEESCNAIKDKGREICGTLQIASNLTLGIYVVPRIVKSFRDAYPRVNVEILLENTYNVRSAVKKHQAHFGFIGIDLKEPLIAQHPFYQDKLVVVIGKNHPIKAETIRWNKLLELPFIGREKGSDIRECYENWFKEKGIRIDPRVEINNTEAIKQSVQECLGFSILPRCTVEQEVRQGLIRILSVPSFNPIQNFYICHYLNSNFSKTEKTFLASLFDRLTTGPPSFPEGFDQLFGESSSH